MVLTKRHTIFLAYSLLIAAAHFSAMRALVELGRVDATASHHILIPIVSLVLLYLSQQSIFSSVRVERVAGTVVIAAGLGFSLFAQGLVGSHGSDLTLTVLGVIVLWIGGFLLLYGPAASRLAIFPLLLLLFAVPIPAFVLDPVVWFLKVGSTEIVAVLFGLVGTPFYREDFVFTLPGVAIEIADQCSGIRSSIGLVLTVLLVAHLYFTKRWTKAVLLSAVIPLSILKNGIRIVTLSLLSIHVDPGFLTGGLHHQGGVVFFILALVMLVPLFIVLQRYERGKQPSVSQA